MLPSRFGESILSQALNCIYFLPKFKLWIKLFRVSIMSDTEASSALTGWWIHSSVSCQAKQWSDLFRSKSWSFYVNSTIIVFAIIRRRFGQFGKIHPRRTVWHWLIREKSQPDLFSFFSFSLLFSFLFLPFPFTSGRLSLPCLQLNFISTMTNYKLKTTKMTNCVFRPIYVTTQLVSACLTLSKWINWSSMTLPDFDQMNFVFIWVGSSS